MKKRGNQRLTRTPSAVGSALGTNPQDLAPTRLDGAFSSLPPAPRQGGSSPLPQGARHQSRSSPPSPQGRRRQTRLPPSTDPRPERRAKRRTPRLPPTRFPPRGTRRVPTWTGGHLSACPHPPGCPNPRQRLPRRRRRHHHHHRCSRLPLDPVLLASVASPSSSAPLSSYPVQPRGDSPPPGPYSSAAEPDYL